jgi:hypothetical protein
MRHSRRAFALGAVPAALVALGEIRRAGAKDYPPVTVMDPAVAAGYGQTYVVDDGPKAPHLGGGKHHKHDKTPPPGTVEPYIPEPGQFCGACETDADCTEEGNVCGTVEGVCGPPEFLCNGKFLDCGNRRHIVCPDDGGDAYCRLGRKKFRRLKGRDAPRGDPWSYCGGTGPVCAPGECPPEPEPIS